MHKFHVTVVALLLAGAAVLGAVAVTRTTGLGSAARHTNDAAIAARTKQLAAYASKLRQELSKKPPALPAIPKRPASAARAGSGAPRIVYQQAPTVVVTLHHKHHDDGGSDGGGGGDG